MSHKYMLLSNGPCKVPLKCDDNGFVLVIAGQAMCFDDSTERLWVYWLCQAKNKGLFAEHLRNCIKGELTPMDIDLAVAQFVGERTPIPVDEYRLEDVPLAADPQRGLSLLIPCYSCIISPQDEIELMQMIIAEPYDTVMLRLRAWFRKYCIDYGLNYDKKCKGQQYQYLAEAFLEQHGISPLPAKPKVEQSKPQQSGNAMKSLAAVVIVAVVWFAITTVLLDVGDTMAKESSGWLGPVLFMVGAFCLGLPIYLLSKLKK